MTAVESREILPFCFAQGGTRQILTRENATARHDEKGSVNSYRLLQSGRKREMWEKGGVDLCCFVRVSYTVIGRAGVWSDSGKSSRGGGE